MALSHRCLTKALRDTSVDSDTDTDPGGGVISLFTPGLTVSSPSTVWSTSTPADAVGDPTSQLICRRALASIVDTLDALDVDGDLLNHIQHKDNQPAKNTYFIVHSNAGFCRWGPGANIEDGSSLIIMITLYPALGPQAPKVGTFYPHIPDCVAHGPVNSRH